MLRSISDCLYAAVNLHWEMKFRASTRYDHWSVHSWKKQFGLSAETVRKILENIRIIRGREIHELIRCAVRDNPDIFLGENCYVTSFHEPGRSGHNIFYEWCHATNVGKRLENRWGYASLPPESRIVFVDDLIGTGNQSLEYIQTKLSGTFKPSHRPCLFSVCGTPVGMNNVKENSTFDVVCALKLSEAEYSFYHESNPTFSDEEKEQIQKLNRKLGETAFFGMGLLIAFFYTTPDNTMPLIWNNGVGYLDDNGKQESWCALLPRTTFAD